MGDDRDRQQNEAETQSFSAWLVAFRKKLGFSQEQLAHEMGVSVKTIQRWENGKFPRFLNLQDLWRIGVENNQLPFIGKLDFATIFFSREPWRIESREDERRVYLKATVQNQIGITAKMLTIISDHGGNLVRLAGFEDASEDTSILRVIFVLPEEHSLAAVDKKINELEDVVTTEYPARLSADMVPEEVSDVFKVIDSEDD